MTHCAAYAQHPGRRVDGRNLDKLSNTQNLDSHRLKVILGQDHNLNMFFNRKFTKNLKRK